MSDCIYWQLRMPALQNVNYAPQAEAHDGTLADVELVRNGCSELVYNRCFDATLALYESAYQNEQVCTA